MKRIPSGCGSAFQTLGRIARLQTYKLNVRRRAKRGPGVASGPPHRLTPLLSASLREAAIVAMTER